MFLGSLSFKCDTCSFVSPLLNSKRYSFNRFNKEFAGNINQNKGHNSILTRNSNPHTYVTTQKSNPLATPETVVNTNWHVDNGATNHVTSDYSNLSNISEYSGIENVVVGNGSKPQITCVGNANLTHGKSS